MRDSTLSWRAKLTAFTLSTYMDSSGSAFPSIATLAHGASLGKKTVDKALPELEAGGFLVIDHGRNRRGNIYRAQLPETAHDARSSEWKNSAPQVRNSAPQVRNSAPRAQESAESAESVFKRMEERAPAARSKIYDDGIIG